MSAASASISSPGADGSRWFVQVHERTRAGDLPGARRLLDEAAQAGHLAAKLQLGVWHLVGMTGPVDVSAAVTCIREAADAGHGAAQTLLAQLIAAGAGGLSRDFAQALARLMEAARGGEPRAVVQLAVLMPNAPEHADVRLGLWRAAAAAGDPIGKMFAERSSPSSPCAPVDWDAVASRVAWPHLRALPLSQMRSAQPRIRLMPGLLTADECLYAAMKGLPLLRPARIVSPDGRSALDPIRTNDAAKLGLLEADVVVQSLDMRVAAALGHPAEHGEGFALLRYQVGQQYLPHCDWIDPHREGTRAGLEQWGQRVATCVVYLNDAFEGGATAFPKLGIEIRGSVGDALLWDNLRQDGSVDPLTLHTGRPPTQGVKYVLSKWMRDRSQAGHEA